MADEMRILIRIEEAADRVGLGRSKVYELIRAGEIPAVKIGRSTRVPVRALTEWAERLEAAQRHDG